MSAPATPSSILSSLGSEAFDELLGIAESLALEFKSQPYRLDQPYQRQELAKDVSAIANSGEGLILVGVKTERDDIHLVDTAVEVVPVPSDMVDVKQYQDIIASWIYPPPEGIRVVWHRSQNDATRGLLSIYVPAQAHSRKPFLVNRLFEYERHLGAIFGYFRRHESDAAPASVHEAQSLMRDGLLFRRIVDARYRGESETEPRNATESWKPVDVYTERVNKLLEEVQIDGPTYILGLVLRTPIDYSAIFESRQHQAVELIARPPELRGMGFDLQAGYTADMVRGELRRSSTPGYKALELWRDGALFFAATGGEEFLSWGRRDNPEGPLVVNQVALIESTYLFTELSRQLLGELDIPGLDYTLEVRNMCVDGKRPILRPGPLSHHQDGWFGRKTAPGCDHVVRVSWQRPIDPNRIAYQLVSQLYAWFGLEHENMPYVDRSSPVPKIDPQSIAAI